MATEIVHSVFVSSTYEDLKQERAEVQKAVLKFHCLPIGMELFPSSDEEAWEYIKRQILGCDYYILIIGGRYGSLAPDGMSFTEKEYRFAKEHNKPCIAFIQRNRDALPPEKRDDDPDKRQKLEKFISDVKKSLISEFTTPHELAANAAPSFVHLRELRPSPGYIRADAYRSLAADIFEGHDRKVTLSMRSSVPSELKSSHTQFLDDADATKIEMSIGQIFCFLAPCFSRGGLRTSLGKTEAELESSLATALITLHTEVRAFDALRLSFFGKVKSLEPFADVLLKRKLISVRIDSGTEYWRITEYGRCQYDILTKLHENIAQTTSDTSQQSS